MIVMKAWERGYEHAIWALGYSFGKTKGDFVPYYLLDNNKIRLIQELKSIADKLRMKNGGEDKFLRQISLGFYIKAPRYWWPEMDQYKVGCTTQSESTMHTICKNQFEIGDFQVKDNELAYEYIRNTVKILNDLREKFIQAKNEYDKKNFWYTIIKILPQSYLQARLWTCNYAVLKNICINRKGHRLYEWKYFIDEVKVQIDHPELLKEF